MLRQANIILGSPQRLCTPTPRARPALFWLRDCTFAVLLQLHPTLPLALPRHLAPFSAYHTTLRPLPNPP